MDLLLETIKVSGDRFMSGAKKADMRQADERVALINSLFYLITIALGVAGTICFYKLGLGLHNKINQIISLIGKRLKKSP